MLKLKFERIICYIVLFLLVVFCAYLLRGELRVVSFVNDDAFQFALVDEARQIWKNIFSQKLSFFYLFDSFNSRWSEGFALSMFYPHLPQAIIALFSFTKIVNIFLLFKITKYLFLILLPVSFFISARVLGFSYFYALITAILSQLTFTNGLYGIDVTSYVWRGWGLTSQLFAVFFLPLAFAFTIRYLKDKKWLFLAVFFNVLVAQCHLGVFFFLCLSYPIFAIFNREKIKEIFSRGLILLILIILFTAYYFVPFFIFSSVRNFSYWDPLWKFNSYGWQQIVAWFLNGELFDFNRLPIVTYIVFLSFFWGAGHKYKFFNYLSGLFVLYLGLFFGRETYGRIIDIVPGMSEFHIHRFIVPFQIFGIYLAAGLIDETFNKIKTKKILAIVGLILGLCLVFYAQRPIVKYLTENNNLIYQDNLSYEKDGQDYERLVEEIKKGPPARIYAGRPGNWGRQLKVGSTQVYMALTVDNLPVIGFAPESWSPNSEYDQFFSETNLSAYDLYNVRYVVTGEDFKPPDFFQKKDRFGKYFLYEITTEGWFSLGKSQQVVYGEKNHLINITKLWLESFYQNNRQFPQILSQSPDVKMINEHEYINYDGKTYSLWQKNPVIYEKNEEKLSQTEEILPAGFRTKFSLKNDCPNCILILKNTYHPNWQVTINGKKIKSFPVMPFYIGISITKAGEYDVTAVYKPNGLKIVLIWIIVVLAGLSATYEVGKRLMRKI